MGRTVRKKRVNNNNFYIDGNNVRKIDVRNWDQDDIKISQKNSQHSKGQYLSVGYAAMLAVSAIIFGLLCVSRLQLQAECTATIKNIGKIEAQLNELKSENDDEFARLNNRMNLFEIRDAAIEDLGMVYAGQNQIIRMQELKENRVIVYENISNK